jgi:hypothetical protein
MAFENRNLPVGTRLVANYKKTRFVCTVVAGEEEGQTAFALEDGKTFKSPSAAGSARHGQDGLQRLAVLDGRRRRARPC